MVLTTSQAFLFTIVTLLLFTIASGNRGTVYYFTNNLLFVFIEKNKKKTLCKYKFIKSIID